MKLIILSLAMLFSFSTLAQVIKCRTSLSYSKQFNADVFQKFEKAFLSNGNTIFGTIRKGERCYENSLEIVEWVRDPGEFVKDTNGKFVLDRDGNKKLKFDKVIYLNAELIDDQTMAWKDLTDVHAKAGGYKDKSDALMFLKGDAVNPGPYPDMDDATLMTLTTFKVTDVVTSDLP